jgi:YHYH protein
MKRRFIQLAVALFVLVTTLHLLDLGNLISLPGTANLYKSEIPLTKMASGSINLKRIPLGDGKLASSPQTGWIWPCRIGSNHIGGAHRRGSWIEGDRTYDLTTKVVVKGAVTWPQRFTMSTQDDLRIFETNDLPSHPTGIYPITPKDNAQAYRYDRNPNRIAAQKMRVELPIDPTLAPAATCTPGAIGILNTGSVLFNALDAPGRDALAHEVQDGCQGHPEPSGVYHYHSISTCLPDKTTRNGHSELVGYILDGFGIYGRHGIGGKVLASADLDECHGHTHIINWNGRDVEMYHYHATWDFPYTVGCMRGTYKMSDVRTIRGNPRRRPPSNNPNRSDPSDRWMRSLP